MSLAHVLLIAFLCGYIANAKAASCRGACHQAQEESLTSSCLCDAHCLDLGNCCDDFATECPAQHQRGLVLSLLPSCQKRVCGRSAPVVPPFGGVFCDCSVRCIASQTCCPGFATVCPQTYERAKLSLVAPEITIPRTLRGCTCNRATYINGMFSHYGCANVGRAAAWCDTSQLNCPAPNADASPLSLQRKLGWDLCYPDETSFEEAVEITYGIPPLHGHTPPGLSNSGCQCMSSSFVNFQFSHYGCAVGPYDVDMEAWCEIEPQSCIGPAAQLGWDVCTPTASPSHAPLPSLSPLPEEGEEEVRRGEYDSLDSVDSVDSVEHRDTFDMQMAASVGRDGPETGARDNDTMTDSESEAVGHLGTHTGMQTRVDIGNSTQASTQVQLVERERYPQSEIDSDDNEKYSLDSRDNDNHNHNNNNDDNNNDNNDNDNNNNNNNNDDNNNNNNNKNNNNNNNSNDNNDNNDNNNNNSSSSSNNNNDNDDTDNDRDDNNNDNDNNNSSNNNNDNDNDSDDSDAGSEEPLEDVEDPGGKGPGKGQKPKPLVRADFVATSMHGSCKNRCGEQPRQDVAGQVLCGCSSGCALACCDDLDRFCPASSVATELPSLSALVILPVLITVGVVVGLGLTALLFFFLCFYQKRHTCRSGQKLHSAMGVFSRFGSGDGSYEDDGLGRLDPIEIELDDDRRFFSHSNDAEQISSSKCVDARKGSRAYAFPLELSDENSFLLYAVRPSVTDVWPEDSQEGAKKRIAIRARTLRATGRPLYSSSRAVSDASHSSLPSLPPLPVLPPLCTRRRHPRDQDVSSSPDSSHSVSASQSPSMDDDHSAMRFDYRTDVSNQSVDLASIDFDSYSAQDSLGQTVEPLGGPNRNPIAEGPSTSSQASPAAFGLHQRCSLVGPISRAATNQPYESESLGKSARASGISSAASGSMLDPLIGPERQTTGVSVYRTSTTTSE